MNAFEAAEQSGRAEELHSQLLGLANAHNKSTNDGTLIPATFLRVTVCFEEETRMKNHNYEQITKPIAVARGNAEPKV